jgi:hypothetical protein
VQAGGAGVSAGGGAGGALPDVVVQAMQALVAALQGQSQSSSSSSSSSAAPFPSPASIAELHAKFARLEEQRGKESSSRKRKLQHLEQQQELKETKTRKIGIAGESHS